MARLTSKTLLLLTAVLSLLPPIGLAQSINVNRLPLTINSETMVFDGKTSTMIYTGVQFIQGDISIEADEGRATTEEQTDSTWQFIGNVIINVSNGHIECDAAELRFDGSALTTAIATGSPATFELTRATSNDVTYAEAGKLKYDVAHGIIEFSEQATITESGNEISSNFLVYNINERQINADSSGNGDDRVRITYTPSAADLEQDQVETNDDSDNP
jgi:lipopolysaccharide export system protein LptA